MHFINVIKKSKKGRTIAMKRMDFLATDGIGLNGLLYESKEQTETVILAVHGMSSNCFKKRDEVISSKANDAQIDYFCFNNRGSELTRYIRRNIDNKQEKILGGTSYEDVLEGYEDIVGAIIKLKELGYKNIYLQGHSLGCTKIVYTYNELLEEEEEELLSNVKGVILLSLIDIPKAIKVYLGDKLDEYLQLAEQKEEKQQSLDLMPKEAFIHPLSVKTFLRYTRDNKEIDFANYGEDSKFEKLNQIKVPLMMRWGNKNEMILQKADELVKIVNNSIINSNKDIDYIDGADHGYTGKEEELANQIINFIKK